MMDKKRRLTGKKRCLSSDMNCKSSMGVSNSKKARILGDNEELLRYCAIGLVEQVMEKVILIHKRMMKNEAFDIQDLADKLQIGSRFHMIGVSIRAYPIWSCLKYIPDRLSRAALSCSICQLLVALFSDQSIKRGLDETTSSMMAGNMAIIYHQDLEKFECVSDVSSTLTSPQLALSVVFSENKMAEMGLGSSSSSLSTISSSSSSFSIGSHSFPELSHTNFSQKAEKICYNSVNSIGCLSNLYGTPSSFNPLLIISYDNKVVDVGLSFSSSVLSLESNDDVVSLDGSPGNRYEYCCECTQLEAFMSSLEIGEKKTKAKKPKITVAKATAKIMLLIL
ncbi:hypothetical protein F0562_010793 [Nyssa sinensis]|uniref:Uncharacterized protein n=1 Tax=Nyssa sinensis TaxID=561372 RepID=A0A5J5A1N8_9ASTE|nr:hypothetical protein F0562_010793 [Nyssa sinensis]